MFIIISRKDHLEYLGLLLYLSRLLMLKSDDLSRDSNGISELSRKQLILYGKVRRIRGSSEIPLQSLRNMDTGQGCWGTYRYKKYMDIHIYFPNANTSFICNIHE